MGWTSIYQLFWCSPGVQGFDPLPYQAAQCSIYLRRLTFYKKWTTFSPGVSANAESASLWPEAWSSRNWCHRYPQTPVWIKESTRVNMNEDNLCVDSVGQHFPDLTWRHDMSPCQDVRCMLVRLVMVHVQGPPYQHPSLGWKHTHTYIYIYVCIYIHIHIYIVYLKPLASQVPTFGGPIVLYHLSRIWFQVTSSTSASLAASTFSNNTHIFHMSPGFIWKWAPLKSKAMTGGYM